MRIVGDYDKPNAKQTSNVQRGELFERAAKRNLKKFHALIPCTNGELFEHAAKRSLKKFHALIPLFRYCGYRHYPLGNKKFAPP